MKDIKLKNCELGRISPEDYRSLPEGDVAVVLDNVRSAHNVGSVFRTCDAFRVKEIYLCGICALPPSPEIHKTALGAEETVAWRHCPDTLETVMQMKREGWTVVSVEQTRNAVQLSDFARDPSRRYALVFGNEVAGVQQEVVDESDFALEIPQWGTKHSLNVSVSAGIVLWNFKPINTI